MSTITMDTRKVRLDLHSKTVVEYLSYIISCMIPVWWLKRTIDRMPAANKSKFSNGSVLVVTGSDAESLNSPHFNERAPSKSSTPLLPKSDFDAMVVKEFCVIGRTVDPQTHVVIDTTVTSPGYLRLEHLSHCETSSENSNVSCELGRHHGTLCYNEISNKQVLYISAHRMKLEHMEWIAGLNMSGTPSGGVFFPGESKVSTTTQGPAVSVSGMRFGRVGTELSVYDSYDFALALVCNSWPERAEEWLHRQRDHDWPSKGIIEKISKDGCHVVAVPHPHSRSPEIEWRFSFTMAEQKLAHSLSDHQRRCYIFFKMIITNVVSPQTVVSSYCLKNILFWTVESLPQSTWKSPYGLGQCFLLLLDQLMHCLSEHKIPHYFIRDNNLIAVKPRNAVKSVLGKLVMFRGQPLVGIFAFENIHHLPMTMQPALSSIFPNQLPTVETLSDYRQAISPLIRRQLHRCGHDITAETFSEILENAICINPRFNNMVEDFAFSLQKMELPSDMKHGDVKILQTAGMAWCAFIHYIHSNNKNQLHDKYQYIDCIFEKSIDIATNCPNTYGLYARVLFGMFLQWFHRYEDSLRVLELALVGQEKALLDNPACSHQVVNLDPFTAVGLDRDLKMEVGFQRIVCCPLIPLAYHVLLLAHVGLKESETIKHFVPLYEEQCRKFGTFSWRPIQVAAINSFRLLAVDLKNLYMFENAISAFQSQKELVQQYLPGAGKISQIEKDIRFCKQMLSLQKK